MNPGQIDMHSALKMTLPIAEGIERLFHPFAEVVIHDIKTNQIVAIYNAFSKRKVGDPSLLSEEDELLTLKDCTGPYQKTNWDGKVIKSISSLIKDEKGKAIGLFCVNVDVSQFEACRHLINSFMQNEMLEAIPTPLFKDDWQEKINQYIHAYLKEEHLSLESLNKTEKRKLIQHLKEIGAFTGKNAAQYIAQLLKVSRATVYNYLE